MTMKNVPNFITCIRILGTIILLFIEPFTVGFFVLYTFSGVTDILDGLIARKYNAISELGSKLDSIADIFYYMVMVFKILPVLVKILPVYVWYMLFGVVAVRLLSYIIAAVRYRCLASHHTYLNKMSGFSAFLAPYFVTESMGDVYCTVVAVIVSVASLEELMMHIVFKEYRADMKTIFCK